MRLANPTFPTTSTTTTFIQTLLKRQNDDDDDDDEEVKDIDSFTQKHTYTHTFESTTTC